MWSGLSSSSESTGITPAGALVIEEGKLVYKTARLADFLERKPHALKFIRLLRPDWCGCLVELGFQYGTCQAWERAKVILIQRLMSSQMFLRELQTI